MQCKFCQVINSEFPFKDFDFIIAITTQLLKNIARASPLVIFGCAGYGSIFSRNLKFSINRLLIVSKMPGQRTIPNFFSVITSVNAAANSGNGSQSNSIRNGRRALETSSWIINEIQQAQSQIQQALQGNLAEFIPNNANTANGSAVSPTLMSQGNPFLHPRQSAQAEMMPLHSEINNDSSSIRHNPGVNAALTRSPSINIVNDEFDDAYGSHGINSPTIDPSRVLRFEVGDLNTFSLRNGATIQRIAEGNVNMQVSGSRSVSSSTRSGNSNQATLQPPHSQQQHQIQTTLHSAPPSALRNKIVYRLNCAYCKINVCERAMRAILLADTKIELYSTDIPPRALRTLDEDRLTQGCNCRIRDTLCSEWYSSIYAVQQC